MTEKTGWIAEPLDVLCPRCHGARCSACNYTGHARAEPVLCDRCGGLLYIIAGVQDVCDVCNPEIMEL